MWRKKQSTRHATLFMMEAYNERKWPNRSICFLFWCMLLLNLSALYAAACRQALAALLYRCRGRRHLKGISRYKAQQNSLSCEIAKREPGSGDVPYLAAWSLSASNYYAVSALSATNMPRTCVSKENFNMNPDSTLQDPNMYLYLVHSWEVPTRVVPLFLYRISYMHSSL